MRNDPTEWEYGDQVHVFRLGTLLVNTLASVVSVEENDYVTVAIPGIKHYVGIEAKDLVWIGPLGGLNRFDRMLHL